MNIVEVWKDALKGAMLANCHNLKANALFLDRLLDLTTFYFQLRI